MPKARYFLSMKFGSIENRKDNQTCKEAKMNFVKCKGLCGFFTIVSPTNIDGTGVSSENIFGFKLKYPDLPVKIRRDQDGIEFETSISKLISVRS